MPGTIQRTVPFLFDQDTGEQTGYVNPVTGRETSSGAVSGASLPALLAAGARAHFFGDSITAATAGWVPSLCAASGGSLVPVANSAVSGYSSAQVLATVQAGISPIADIAVVQCGTNDPSAGISVAQTTANTRSIIDLIRAARKIPVLCLPPPVESSPDVLNQRSLRQWLLAREMGVMVIDAYRRWRDTDQTWVSGASTDGIHPNAETYPLIGIDAWNAINAGTATIYQPTKNAGYGILGTSNVLHLTDSNADGFPDGWSQTGFSGATFARSDYSYPWIGKRCSATVSQSAAAAVYKNVNTGFAPGDRLLLTGVMGVASSTNMLVSAYLRAKAGSTIVSTLPIFSASATRAETNVCAEFVVPAGGDFVELYLNCAPLVTGAYSGEWSWGNFELYNTTALLAS